MVLSQHLKCASLLIFQDYVHGEGESFIPEEATDHNTWNEAKVLHSGPSAEVLQCGADGIGTSGR